MKKFVLFFSLVLIIAAGNIPAQDLPLPPEEINKGKVELVREFFRHMADDGEIDDAELNELKKMVTSLKYKLGDRKKDKIIIWTVNNWKGNWLYRKFEGDTEILKIYYKNPQLKIKTFVVNTTPSVIIIIFLIFFIYIYNIYMGKSGTTI